MHHEFHCQNFQTFDCFAISVLSFANVSQFFVADAFPGALLIMPKEPLNRLVFKTLP